MKILLICCSLLLSLPVAAMDEELVNPTEDAKVAYQSGNTEYVAIALQNELEIPGLKAWQLEVVKRDYKTRSLNRRWKTFDNIEQQPKRYRRIKRYAIRYNLMMWKLTETAQSPRFKYRY
ncbi:MAG: hypothetical protein MK185_05250 [Saccharospirillaceae bacterium]|nr:hypothetical protein [Saccharospirillaceae bacterium]